MLIWRLRSDASPRERQMGLTRFRIPGYFCIPAWSGFRVRHWFYTRGPVSFETGPLGLGLVAAALGNTNGYVVVCTVMEQSTAAVVVAPPMRSVLVLDHATNLAPPTSVAVPTACTQSVLLPEPAAVQTGVGSCSTQKKAGRYRSSNKRGAGTSKGIFIKIWGKVA